jgi:hypothetical protein
MHAIRTLGNMYLSAYDNLRSMEQVADMTAGAMLVADIRTIEYDQLRDIRTKATRRIYQLSEIDEAVI